MRPIEQWIWLPSQIYPEKQTTYYTHMAPNGAGHYTAAAFERNYTLGKAISHIRLRVSGDTAFRLWINNTDTVYGPPSSGGDFLFNEMQRPAYYAYTISIAADETPEMQACFTKGTLAFYAEVRMQSERMYEYSRGHGGFMLTAEVIFADGTKAVLLTDASWTAKWLSAYRSPGVFDGRAAEEQPIAAEIIPNIWHCEDAPIPPCTVTAPPTTTVSFPLIAAGTTIEHKVPFDMIYAGYLSISGTIQDGAVTVRIYCRETEEHGSNEICILTRDHSSYRGFGLHSAGELQIHIENTGSCAADVTVAFCTSHYPVTTSAQTATSDTALNRVFDVCKHTLQYCRQTLHLDSPRHCEPLACTGDYYIESLMTAFTFGDMRLAAFDVRRTAELLRYHEGRMFHTSYSLLWVQMLWDVYLLTGEKDLLADCEQALILLLERFSTYLGENGLIETPPDYMFIDWLNPDGISMHHPPKALGQTCLCMFYYGALQTAAKIFTELQEPAMAKQQTVHAATLRRAILSQLYDADRGLFFEGLNTPTPDHLCGGYMPQNTNKRYYRRHANILAAYSGLLAPDATQALLRRIMEDDTLGNVQPYFMHFWLDAIYRNGLREEQTLRLLALWKAPVAACDKGLTEGFYKPEPTYQFDHSHAWGGTPAYALPLALSGLTILEAGYQKIRLSPSLLGLEYAHVEIPTPYGLIALDMNAGEPPRIHIPNEINAEFPAAAICEKL